MDSTLLLSFFVYAGLALAAFGLAYWAYRARQDRSAYVGLYLLFGIPAVLLIIAGAATTLASVRLGVILLVIGLGLGLPLLGPVRRLVAAVTPMDPASPVDMTGLCLLFATLAILGLNVVLQSTSDTSATSTVSAVSVPELIGQLAFEVVVTYAAVGYWYVRDFRAATDRLGIVPPTLRLVLVAMGGVVLGYIASIAGSLLTEWLQPALYAKVNDVTQQMTADVQNPLGAAILGISAGVGEELLFRGALQPRFGIGLIAVTFALLHAPQYGFSFVILGLFGVALVLGWERRRYGTTASIITHALYNMLAVLAQSLT